MLFENFIFFVISGFFLIISGVYLVKSLHKISGYLGIPDFSAAFIIMAFATSIPELLVGISSAFQGIPEISMGNVLGANIINLTLIMGIFILMNRGVEIKSEKIGRGIYFMFASIVLLVTLYLIGNSLSRIDGLILIIFFSFSTALTIKERRKIKQKTKVKKPERKGEKLEYFFIFLVSLVALFISSNYAVHFASGISLDLNIPNIFIGLFLISFATTLPELIFGIDAIILKRPQMSIGDQTGTIFTNICLVLGIVSILEPITTSLTIFLVSGGFLLLSAIIFTSFVKSDKKLSIQEGVSLIILYFAFAISQFFIGV